MRLIRTKLPDFRGCQLSKTIIKTTLLVTEFGYYYITKKKFVKYLFEFPTI